MASHFQTPVLNADAMGRSTGTRRRKFSKPPVKVACLLCRSLRTRCDGQKRCGNCVARGVTCSYTASKRGGPRVRTGIKISTVNSYRQANTAKHESQPVASTDEQNDININPDINFDDDAWFNQLVGLSEPGAGLSNVEMPISEIETLFDSIFGPKPNEPSSINPPLSLHQQVQVQIYGSDEDILNAYYVFIHPYYPVLPPPERPPVCNRPLTTDRTSSFEPSTPLSLVISALLVLIPHPDEHDDPLRLDYVRLRRDYAHSFAQSALEAVEVDAELLDSTNDPANVLSGESPMRLDRESFHPKVPVSLESVLALNLLSVYEYAQRGNMGKMRNRAGQALTAAMSLSLHESLEVDEFTEARRRAWWMTYVTVCQGSIVSNTPAVFDVYDPRFVTPLPTFASDPEGWKFFIDSQRTILAATTFVHDLDRAVKSGSDLSPMHLRMRELDRRSQSVLALRRGPRLLSQLPGAAPVGASEAIVAKAIRSISEIKLFSSRIKTHRYCAFSDMPIFQKKHCDLNRVNDPSTTAAPSDCNCRSLLGSVPSSATIPSPPDSHSSVHSVSSGDAGAPMTFQFPFSSHTSAKICLQSALNIVTILDNLPYPNPTNANMHTMRLPPPLSPRSPIEAPRTMPTFACCAMQASYALLMLCYKTHTLRGGTNQPPSSNGATQTTGSTEYDLNNGPNEVTQENPLLTGFVNDLYQGLQLAMKSLGNYALAFEALQGMKNEISQAVERTFDGYRIF